jgi:hypothetical protein
MMPEAGTKISDPVAFTVFHPEKEDVPGKPEHAPSPGRSD